MRIEEEEELGTIVSKGVGQEEISTITGRHKTNVSLLLQHVTNEL